MTIERRMTPGGEVKVETREGKGPMLVGYGAVFHRAEDPGTEFNLARDLKERISPTAFTRAIQDKHDARALFNHDPNMILGRVGNGTMRLTADSVGLRYEIDLPDTQVGRDVAASVARGDITGSSFAFRVKRQQFTKGEGFDVRTIEDVDLLDTGPVVFPAYTSTTTGTRAGDCADAFEARDEWRKRQEAIAVRLRLIEIDA